jgi:putative sugar O-methyltransferase
VLEYYSATSSISQNTAGPLTIAELGGGYGRTAYVFLKARRCKYVLFDIPPALAVCQRYLRAVFPDRTMFTFRPFKKYEEIRAEYEAAEICIMTPNQIELLPTKTFDLLLNISSFGEMTSEQIEHYYQLIDRYCRGYFYTRQWQEHVNDHDGITISVEDYPTPHNWQLVYSRQHPIQARFFEALYKV